MAAQTTVHPSRTTSASTRRSDSEPEELPLDVVYDLLSNERRRIVLRYLRSESGTTTLGTLAERIASIENDKPVEALSSAERKRVYICLYQCHLPKMDDADAIDFEENRKTVDVGERFEDVTRFLPAEEDYATSGGPAGWTTTLAAIARGIGNRLRASESA